jgi:hypothetical protein
MKSKKNKNNKSKPKIDAFGIESINPKLVGPEVLDYYLKQEELKNQTWPIWLLPNDFRDWYKYEQRCRKDSGNNMLPDPPIEIIHKVFNSN